MPSVPDPSMVFTVQVHPLGAPLTASVKSLLALPVLRSVCRKVTRVPATMSVWVVCVSPLRAMVTPPSVYVPVAPACGKALGPTAPPVTVATVVLTATGVVVSGSSFVVASPFPSNRALALPPTVLPARAVAGTCAVYTSCTVFSASRKLPLPSTRMATAFTPLPGFVALQVLPASVEYSAVAVPFVAVTLLMAVKFRLVSVSVISTPLRAAPSTVTTLLTAPTGLPLATVPVTVYVRVAPVTAVPPGETVFVTPSSPSAETVSCA